MSFELFLQRFSGGEPAGFAPADVREAFGDALSELEEDFWQVDYGDGQSSDLFVSQLDDNPKLFHNISVHRPCAHPRLYQALWALLDHSGSCLYFPGDCAPLSRDPGIASHLPPDMLEDLGQPIQLRSAGEILAAIEAG